MRPSDIEKLVQDRPGLSFTELKENTGAANGQLQYHLRKADVEKHGRGYVRGGYCEECQLKKICTGNCIRFHLRQHYNRKILKELGKKKKLDIADELNITPSSLSFHIEQLEENNLIQNGEVNPLVRDII